MKTPFYLDYNFWQIVISALTLLTAALTIFKLFSRDKEREEQITQLTKIATAQSDILKEFQQQTSEFEKQTSQMRLQLASQNEKDGIEMRIRMNEIKPHFVGTVMSKQDDQLSFQVYVKNQGEIASNVIAINKNDQMAYLSPVNAPEVPTKKSDEKFFTVRHLNTLQTYPHGPMYREIEFTLSFMDKDSNKYEQKGRMNFQKETTFLQAPVLVTPQPE